MDAKRLEQIQSLFLEAAERPPLERRAWLAGQCGDDDRLISEVLAMCDAESHSGTILDQPIQLLSGILTGQAAAPGEAIASYRLLRVLGEGGTSTVYLAEREDIGSRVALKVLRDALLSPLRRGRFLAERRILAQLNHPNIARIVDAGTLPGGTPWFAMEHVDGARITDYASGLSLPQRLKLFRMMCTAVQFAHEQAILHRDIKPSNVLVKPDGTVKLLDFGIATLVDDRTGVPVERTVTALRMMTPGYAAPERRNGGVEGVAADVYSLGVVLYEMVTGSNPRTGHAGQAEPNFTPPSRSLRGVSSGLSHSDLDVLCLKAVEPDPARRYRTVEALIRDLDHLLNAEPLEARPDSTAYRLRKFLWRNRRTVIAAAVVILLFTALAAYFTARLVDSREEALASAARARSVQRFMERLFEGDEAEVGPSQDLRVVSIVNRGLREAQTLHREPLVQAELFGTLGGVYQNLGDFGEAEKLLVRALERKTALYGPSHEQVADATTSLALLRLGQGKLDDAEKLVNEAIRIARLGKTGSATLARAVSAQGQMVEARGDYKKAVPILEEALRLTAQRGTDTPEYSKAVSALANTHFYTGEYDRSRALNEQALALNRRLFGDAHPFVADDLVNLGAIDLNRGDYKKSEQYNREAVRIFENWYGRRHPQVASALTSLGQAINFQKRFDEAAAIFREALEIQEKVYGPVHSRVAFALNALGATELQKDDLDNAEQHFKRCLEIYRTIYGDANFRTAVALSNISSVYLKRKDWARAEQGFVDVVQRMTAVSATHVNTAIARIKLGRALLGQRKLRQAENHLLGGYEILKSQSNPAVSWLQSAREDLAQVYRGLNEPAKAARFSGEFAANQPKP